MPSYQHKKIIEQIKSLDEPPSDQNDFSNWIQAEAHLEFLRQNARSDELVIYGSSGYSFIYASVVSNNRLEEISQEDLLHWDGTPYSLFASYVWGDGRDDVWVERSTESSSAGVLNSATQLIFGRTFEGWSGSARTYFEVNQEYTHLTGIHWRPEERAYCRFDESGDLEHVVSVTAPTEKVGEVRCISFTWQPLEEYLVATNSTLIRRFDFTLFRRGNFSGWPEGTESVIQESDRLFYRKKVCPGYAAYTTGVQLIIPRRPRRAVFEEMRGERKNRKYVEFTAYDWRNNRTAEISADPKATTNYFEAKNNSLPFELSPAFFKPDVILKYKMDKEKYTVGERDVTCRAAWYLKAIDVNEAGQIHAYICYLRDLPYDEQLYWKSFNERPKAGISERAFIQDFEGKFTTFDDPLKDVVKILKFWQVSGAPWWTLRDERLLEHVNTPLTRSRDEWVEAFMDLAKLVVEGFDVKAIRGRLDKLGIAYKKEEMSITLLEHLINQGSESKEKLTGLQTVQWIRSNIKAHASSGQKVEEFVRKVIEEHESFTAHFEHICSTLSYELQTIANAYR